LNVLAINFKPLPATREDTPTHQPTWQASSSPQSVATSLQPPAVQTVKQNTTLSSSRNPTLPPVSRPTTPLSSTSNQILPLLMKLGVAALVSVGGGYAYLQWQSSNLASAGTSTANSDSTANSGIGNSTANSDSMTKSEKTGTSTTKSEQTDASTTNSDKNELLSEPLSAGALLQRLSGVPKEKVWKVISFLQAEKKLCTDKHGLLKMFIS